MDSERDLYPRQKEAAGLTNLELYRAYYGKVRAINRVRAPLVDWERIGAGAVVVGTVLEAPALVTVGVPILLVSYIGEQILTHENILRRDAIWAELSYRHNLGEISLPRAA